MDTISWKETYETRKKCWRIWLVFSLVTALLVLAQTISGLLQSMEIFAWGWVALLYFPGLLLLFISTLSDRQFREMLPLTVHRMLIGGSLVFLLAILLTLMLEPMATAGNKNMHEYRQQSLYWLLPVEFMVLTGYYLAFFRGQKIFKLDTATVERLAEDKAREEGRLENAEKKSLYQMVARGELEESLSFLHDRKPGKKLLKEVVFLQGQLAQNQKDERLNVISPEETQRQLNRIRLATLHIIDRMESD